MNQFMELRPGIRRACAVIDLDNILHNLKVCLQAVKGNAQIMAVVKADAYGHGDVEIARLLQKEERIWGFATATADEAFLLRKEGIEKPILILGSVDEDCYEEIIREEIRIPIFEEEKAALFEEAAVKAGKTGLFHIKADTGMSRIGLFPDGTGKDTVRRCCSFSHIRAEGIFTHLATADESDPSAAEHQIMIFRKFIQELSEEGITFEKKHMANSAATVLFDNTDFDLCRLGILLYGLAPSEEIRSLIPDVKPVMSLYSEVSYVKEVPEGTHIGYGGTFVTDRKTAVATVSIGYADGYARTLSGKADVLIRGKRCPVIGRICMDQLMADVTELSEEAPVREHERVTLIGTDGKETVTMEEVGRISGRFNYEFACEINKRVPRVFVQGGNIVSVR